MIEPAPYFAGVSIIYSAQMNLEESSDRAHHQGTGAGEFDQLLSMFLGSLPKALMRLELDSRRARVR